MKKNALLKYFIFSLLLCVVQEAEGKIFDAVSFHLDNGLKVILIENHKSPVVKQMVWYKNGASDEKIGSGGIAHLLEHLMFRGTKTFDENRFDEIMNENGVRSNAFTSQDYTAYHQFADVSKLEILMMLEADRMRNLKISDKNFKKERDVVYQERRQEVETRPVAVFMEKLREKLWGKHPYSRPVSGKLEEIQKLKKQDAIDYYERFYTPKNAILILSGDIDGAAVMPMISKYYGSVGNSSSYKKAPVYLLKNSGYGEFTVYDENVKNARIVYIFAVPSYNLNKKDALALEILAEYLGAEKSSPLYKNLVEKEKIVAAISVNNGFSARGYDTFSISLILNENSEQYVAEAAKKLKFAIKKALVDANMKDFDTAKKRILANLVYAADSADTAAYIAGSMAVGGMKVEDIISYDEQIESVTFREFKNTIESAFGYAPAVMGILLPKDNSDKQEEL